MKDSNMKDSSYMTNEIELEQFIGIFPNAVNNEICSEFAAYFNALSEQGLTMSSSDSYRKDEMISIPSGLPHTFFPMGLCQPLWQNLSECFKIYNDKYNIEDYLTSYDFKIHRVQPTGGYHAWHHEHMYTQPHRVLAWHLTIESPKSGGETEFLYQSMRVEPKVGQLLIWPAGFTHKHRGNPPLEGQKTYITGWFNLTQL